MSWASQVDLRDFVPADLLEPFEITFVFNTDSHADFAIYSHASNRPVLIIEVDGYTYHEGDKAQLLRDEKKNHIMKKYNIPLLRFPTNACGEEEILISELSEIVKG